MPCANGEQVSEMLGSRPEFNQLYLSNDSHKNISHKPGLYGEHFDP